MFSILSQTKRSCYFGESENEQIIIIRRNLILLFPLEKNHDSPCAMGIGLFFFHHFIINNLLLLFYEEKIKVFL